jgi:DNA-binding response OmpR family regulator
MKPTSILVVDDESNIRLMLRTSLESEGYAVTEAADGREALDEIHRSTPDLVVLDLNMPRLDGMAVLEQMKHDGPKPRVIVLTAFGSIATAVKATRLGALDFLEKPVTPSVLREAVRSVLLEPELDSPPASAEVGDEYEPVLDRARKLLQTGEFASAESLLMKAADRPARNTADYFNLLGVLYETQKKWRLARKCYGKAISADKKYQPAQLNMRRIYELYTFGRSKQEIVLDDAGREFLDARTAESRN